MERFEKAKGDLFCTRKAELFYAEARRNLDKTVKFLHEASSNMVNSPTFSSVEEAARWQLDRTNEALYTAMYLDLAQLDYQLRYEHEFGPGTAEYSKLEKE